MLILGCSMIHALYIAIITIITIFWLIIMFVCNICKPYLSLNNTRRTYINVSMKLNTKMEDISVEANYQNIDDVIYFGCIQTTFNTIRKTIVYKFTIKLIGSINEICIKMTRTGLMTCAHMNKRWVTLVTNCFQDYII